MTECPVVSPVVGQVEPTRCTFLQAKCIILLLPPITAITSARIFCLSIGCCSYLLLALSSPEKCLFSVHILAVYLFYVWVVLEPVSSFIFLFLLFPPKLCLARMCWDAPCTMQNEEIFFLLSVGQRLSSRVRRSRHASCCYGFIDLVSCSNTEMRERETEERFESWPQCLSSWVEPGSSRQMYGYVHVLESQLFFCKAVSRAQTESFNGRHNSGMLRHVQCSIGALSI